MIVCEHVAQWSTNSAFSGHTISSKYKNNVTYVGRQTQIGQNRAKYSIEISEMWHSYCELIITLYYRVCGHIMCNRRSTLDIITDLENNIKQIDQLT